MRTQFALLNFVHQATSLQTSTTLKASDFYVVLLRQQSMSAQENTYQLIDSGQFRKLEQIGPFRISRPAASAVWDPQLPPSEWQKIDAEFARYKDGNGEWKVRNPDIQQPFTIQIQELSFQIKLTSFGHLGVFPEQATNWRQFQELVGARTKLQKKTRVLNLFAYTGGSTLACSQAGAEVAHVDASKGTVKWASENAKLTQVDKNPIRWLVDDVKEFVARDLRRNAQYEGIILDPPSYGKGEKKQVWKIEEDLMPLLRDLKKMFNPENGAFVCLSAHSEAYTPTSLQNQLTSVFGESRQMTAAEMLIKDTQGRPLPSGASALWVAG
jgi:23S rRNA (cytosine1962-C5)-methyltransferase